MIMGRKTFDSIGQPLPGRPSIVITRNSDWQAGGVQIAQTLDEAFQLARQHTADEMMIIGGASVCETAMPFTERLYLTLIDHEFEGGDTWLSSYQADEWQEQSCESHDETDQGGFRFSYYVFERKS